MIGEHAFDRQVSDQLHAFELRVKGFDRLTLHGKSETDALRRYNQDRRNVRRSPIRTYEALTHSAHCAACGKATITVDELYGGA